MLTKDFDFDLPEDRIALRPVEPRDGARLLLVRDGQLEDRIVRDLAELLRPGDALVFNDTRVIPARLSGHRHRQGDEGETLSVAIEATLHHRDAPDVWSAFMKPGRRIRPGDTIVFGKDSLRAEVLAKADDGLVSLRFDQAGPALDDAIRAIGVMPLPPYIAARRAEDARDHSDYQTVYARHDGSVAAPTAGLHFTPELMQRLAARGVSLHSVTLHVGAGTFLPVKVDDVREHRMHAEWGEVSATTAEALNAVRAAGGRIVCVGTTSLRLIESAAGEDDVLRPFSGDTSIFITPGYRFRAVDVLMTNFHLPRSTLFMLVCAFAGTDTMKRAYAHAIETGYRFYSYGDGSLLFRSGV
ncbi:MAG: tRNA preQ1(34) S-adenosylmethionine ribosyltransferase-isomerase QueA [Brevundimonas sp.]|uniref:tRNA preQ1(34) S-adenosylmethionine ribosyltransferase-isomerase QueA n=1 Tax=Brevundimonas sp. TaxID=1871086 RepID=UPI00391ACBAF